MKKILSFLLKSWNNFINHISLQIKHIRYGEGLIIHGIIFIQGRNISIGRNVTISSGKRANVIGGDCRTILSARENGGIIIGNNVGISNAALISYSCIKIEDNVFVGGGVKIYDSDFHSILYEHRMERPDTHIKTLPVCIKKGVFIGAHSIILRGVTIDQKAVIGAGWFCSNQRCTGW